MTLDAYADLCEGDLEDGAKRLDECVGKGAKASQVSQENDSAPRL